MIKVETNASRLISQLKSYQVHLDRNSERLTGELVNIGFNAMWDRVGNVVYDGNHDDLHVASETKGAEGTITFYGEAAAFVEFGTGVFYPDDHPKAAEFGAVRGAYVKGQGSDPPWIYVGPHGSNGIVLAHKKDGREVVASMGNPANCVVYNTGKDLRQIAESKAKEVFSK